MMPPDQADFTDIRVPVAMRSLALCGLGAVAGLAIAGFGLFTAQGTRTATVPAEDVAIVNSVPILRADFVQQLRSLYDVDLSDATAAQRRKVLEDMIHEELAVQRGVEIGLANDDLDVRQALAGGTEGQVAQDALTSRPTDTELRRWYAVHRTKYASEGTMTIREYVLPSGDANARRVVAALRAGVGAASLGLRSSGRVDDGEEFYFAARLHLGKRLFGIARLLPDGAVSDPVAQDDAIHVLRMVRNVPPVPTPYAEAGDAVLRDFLAAKVARLQAGNARFLRQRADVKIAVDLQ